MTLADHGGADHDGADHGGPDRDSVPSRAGAEPAEERRRIRLLLVTGLSGAGKSTALKYLEDLGYEAVDNLPLSLLSRLVPTLNPSDPEAPRAIAVGIDSRTRDFRTDAVIARVDKFAERGDVVVRLVYFDSDDDVLARRFTETRRRHPLAVDRPVTDGIAGERRLLAPIRERADMVVDTSHMSLPDLRRTLADHFALTKGHGLTVSIMSFSYRHGLPREADLVFDVRFLANPHYVETLREMTGHDAAVGAYVAADENYRPFFEKLSDFLEMLIPHYDREGKSYLTIAIGCTGGRHRSVFVAEELARRISGTGHRMTLRHRETPVGDAAGKA